MQRVVRFNRLAAHYSALATHGDDQLRETYRAIAAAYRTLALSVRIELWWPQQTPDDGSGSQVC